MAVIRNVGCKVSFRYPNGAIRKGRVVKATDVKKHVGDKNDNFIKDYKQTFSCDKI
jgi:hypothetical protein